MARTRRRAAQPTESRAVRRTGWYLAASGFGQSGSRAESLHLAARSFLEDVATLDAVISAAAALPAAVAGVRALASEAAASAIAESTALAELASATGKTIRPHEKEGGIGWSTAHLDRTLYALAPKGKPSFPWGGERQANMARYVANLQLNLGWYPGVRQPSLWERICSVVFGETKLFVAAENPVLFYEHSIATNGPTLVGVSAVAPQAGVELPGSGALQAFRPGGIGPATQQRL